MIKSLFLILLLSSSVVCCENPATGSAKSTDAVFVGAGVMSATLASMLHELDPSLSMEVFERLPAIAQESSSVWNNAGTGHSAFCELNYTTELSDGTVDLSKAIRINESFEQSKQYWSYHVEKKHLLPETFIHNVPHMSFVWGESNVLGLRRRYEAMVQNPLFSEMEYTDDFETLSQWIPLVMEGRSKTQKVAATRVKSGTDVNFGALTHSLMVSALPPHSLHLEHEVRDIEKNSDGRWTVYVRDLKTGNKSVVHTKFLFIGAGGGTLPLLQKTGIEEGKGYGGVPVGGQWLVSTNPLLVAKHDAKVYGKAPIGSPPMSVPHLDTRHIDGQKALLFGPFATFSTKFLKQGSWLDMPLSFNLWNLIPMLQSGWDNIPLTRYLIQQLRLTPEDRLLALKEYFPNAKLEDWTIQTAGQRVQVIKNDPVRGGILQFGTELVLSADGSVAALLGASPGASTAVETMLKVLEHSYKSPMQHPTWKAKLKEMIPSYGQKLSENTQLLEQMRIRNRKLLQLTY